MLWEIRYGALKRISSAQSDCLGRGGMLEQEEKQSDITQELRMDRWLMLCGELSGEIFSSDYFTIECIFAFPLKLEMINLVIN